MATKKRKNRNKKYILSVIATVAVLALIYLITYLLKQSINSVSQDLDGPYDVVSVIDGDTIIVKSDGGDVHVRLIGIDTPESVASDGYKENTPEGDKASEYTRNLLEGNSVYAAVRRRMSMPERLISRINFSEHGSQGAPMHENYYVLILKALV